MTKQGALQICYAYEYDAGNVRTQSGRPYHILQGLCRDHRVANAFPLDRRPRYGFAPLKGAARVRGLVYHTEREPFMLRWVGRQIDRHVARAQPDIVFAPSSLTPAAMTADVPVVYCADSNIYQLFGYYDGFGRVDRRFARHCYQQEEQALARCAGAVFPSDWAAEAAVRVSGADPRKVHVIPFGANIDDPGQGAVEAAINQRTLTAPRILFIGSEWWRKGGDIVLAACARLRAGGLPVSVDLAGVAKVPHLLPDYVRHHGILRKGNPEEKLRLSELLAQADILFVPSRAECYGMTFCEAAAYGLPAISCRTGGIPTIVRDGLTGLLLNEGAPPPLYADAIADLIAAPARYREFALASRADYESRLNWPVFMNRLIAVLRQAAADRNSAGRPTNRVAQPVRTGR